MTALREERGWSRNRLATEAGVVYNTIKLLELGRHDPSLTVLLGLVRAFDLCSVEELLGAGQLGSAVLLGSPHHRP